ncbi:MAG: DUF6504 family protein [Firmicutes bacterium]|jgi:hypothetical protein|nr:DUF6504 family protein [Bacillota bacterium]
MKPIEKIWVRRQVPYAFVWRQQYVLIVRILDYWRDVGEWWRSEPELWFWRIQGQGLEVYELACNPQTHQWWMYHVYD